MDVHICVGALLVRQGDEPRLLLALRSPARRSFPGVWDMPGGHCELGETLETTLVRELQEEIGVTPTAWRHVRDLHEMLPDGNDALKLHVYAVTAWDWNAVQPPARRTCHRGVVHPRGGV